MGFQGRLVAGVGKARHEELNHDIDEPITHIAHPLS
jgi:hypothetical protein